VDNPGTTCGQGSTSVHASGSAGRPAGMVVDRPATTPGDKAVTHHPIDVHPLGGRTVVTWRFGTARRRPRGGPQDCAHARQRARHPGRGRSRHHRGALVQAKRPNRTWQCRHPLTTATASHCAANYAAAHGACTDRIRRRQALIAAIEAGVSGYLLKQVRARTWSPRTGVAAGDHWLDPVTTARVLARIRAAPSRISWTR